METNLPPAAEQKNKLAEIKVKVAASAVGRKIQPIFADPKNRKIIILVGTLLAIIIFLLAASLIYQASKGRQEAKKAVATPQATTVASPATLTVQDRLRSLENEINLGFEDRSMIPPEIEFDIEFKE